MFRSAVLLALALVSNPASQTFDPARRAAELEALRNKQVGDALKAGKSGEIDKIEASIASQAAQDLKRTDLAKVEAKDAWGWAQLAKTAKDYKTECRLIERYLTDHAEAFPARLDYMLACFYLQDGQNLHRMLHETKPANLSQAAELASYMGGTYHYEIRNALGAEATVKDIDLCASFLSKRDTTQPAKGEVGWGLRQLVDAKAAYLAELGRPKDAVATIDHGLKELDDSVYRKADLLASRGRYGLLGSPAPSLPPTAVHGHYTSLESLRGHVVVLDFTAHWCHACIAALPSLEKMYAELHGQGLDVLSVTTYYGFFGTDHVQDKAMPKKEEFDRMPAWMKQHGMPWAMAYVTGETLRAYGVAGIPQIMLIDKKGVIRKVDLGFSDPMFVRFREAVEAALKE